jgi:transposase
LINLLILSNCWNISTRLWKEAKSYGSTGKQYITNTKLEDKQVLDNYKKLWHIEKAFRMSKTDLRIPPIYHRLRNGIEAHIKGSGRVGGDAFLEL